MPWALLLLLTFAMPAGAKPKLAGMAAGDAAFEQSCRVNFARFESGIARDRQANGVVYDKESRLVSRHARFDKITDEDNARFIPMALKANAGEKTEAELFYFSENAVLKELNDKVVADKDLVTALTNLRKDLEHFYLHQDPELKIHLAGQYSDFKTLQIGLNTKDPRVVARLDEKIGIINKKYSDYLSSVAEKRVWREKGSGLAKDSTSWFHAGVGASPDEAALAARDSRYQTLTEKGPRLRSFAEAQSGLDASGRFADRYRTWVAKRFSGVEGMLTDAGTGRYVLSAEAIEAMKKATPLEPTAAGYAESVRAVLKKRFGADISFKEAEALKKYMDLADRFSPPLLMDKRVVIDMSQPAAAVISADFKGQNARNLEETLKALARTEKAPLPNRVKEVRRGEGLATAKL
ncbi:MAG: hypothetical protein EOP11_16840, partial [Proteobacteria bacterium]